MQGTIASSTEIKILHLIQGELYRQFVRIFEYTIAITGEIPLQPCNEMRLVLAHFRNALDDRNSTGAERHLENAEAHIMLASIDCLMISIINRIELFTKMIDALENQRGGNINPKFRLRLDDIRAQRDQAHPRLGARPTDELGLEVVDLIALSRTYNFLMLLLTHCNSLHEGLRDEFPLEEIIKARAQEIWEHSGRPAGLDREHWFEAQAEVLGPFRRH